MTTPTRFDRSTFADLVEPHRAELRLHCYRMLGSPYDAEDLVQESLLRAWRAIDTLRDVRGLRAWLYRIATNACLDAASRRPPRSTPDALTPPANAIPDGEADHSTAWLEPYPDAWLDGVPDARPGPEARYEMREAVRLAFVAAIQLLPPRQRAVLLLRDVLGFSTVETAQLIDASSASVNSALQRARATLARRNLDSRGEPPDARQRDLAEQYAAAWEERSLDALVALLTRDAEFAMPPWRHWYRGRSSVRGFLERAWRAYASFHFVAAGANGQPALGCYARTARGSGWTPHSLHVLTAQEDGISRIACFVPPLGPRLFRAFALAEEPTGDLAYHQHCS